MSALSSAVDPQARLPCVQERIAVRRCCHARVFERKNAEGPKKTHVHVLGCPRCRS